MNTKKGFTLIELLVVVAIIAILSSLILVSVDTIKTKSRDSRRMSDIGEIRNGLNLYFTDTNSFPIYSSGINIVGTDAFSVLLETGGYMKEVPSDPISPIQDYRYTSNSTGTNFTISFCLEGTSIPLYNQGCNNTIAP